MERLIRRLRAKPDTVTERRQVMTAKTRACVETALDCADKDNCPQTAAALGIILRCDGLPRPVIQTLLTMGHSALQLLGR